MGENGREISTVLLSGFLTLASRSGGLIMDVVDGVGG